MNNGKSPHWITPENYLNEILVGFLDVALFYVKCRRKVQSTEMLIIVYVLSNLKSRTDDEG